MKTKSRLILWLGILLLLVTTLTAVGLGTIWKLRSEGREVMKANYNSIEFMQRMLDALDLQGDTAATFRLLADQLARQQANITESGEADLTAQLARHVGELRNAPLDAVIARSVRKDINGIIELNRMAIVRKATDAEERADRAVMWISIVGGVSFLIAFTLFLSLPELIADPIRRLTQGIDRITAGHYRERVQMDRSDEFGHMAERFNAMAAELEKWENSNLARIMEEKSRAEAVINSLQDASIGIDEQGTVLFANQQALDVLALNASDIVGKPTGEAAQVNDLLGVILGGDRQGPLKIVKDGREQFYTLEHLPIAKAGKRLGTVVLLRNVTPFEEKDRAKTHFLATISHELKTPLASTDIGLTLLERQQSTRLAPDQAAIVADLRKDHQRLVRIVSELLDLSQAETGNIRLSIAECTLDRLIDEALASVKVAGQQKHIQFARPADIQRLQVQADPDKAVWVLVNVLSNAIRHSPQHGTIDLETMAMGSMIGVSISDQGPGVPAMERGRLFERFAPGSTPQHGTGLGLSIAREFMQAMGGNIAFDPSKAEGATFILTFAAVPMAA